MRLNGNTTEEAYAKWRHNQRPQDESDPADLMGWDIVLLAEALAEAFEERLDQGAELTLELYEEVTLAAAEAHGGVSGMGMGFALQVLFTFWVEHERLMELAREHERAGLAKAWAEL